MEQTVFISGFVLTEARKNKTYENSFIYALRQRPVAPIAEMDRMEALRRLVLKDGVYQTVWNKLYRRMVYLQKYDELAPLTRQQLLLDCMWHYQCAKKWLKKGQQRQAVQFTRGIIAKTPAVSKEQITLNKKYRCWLFLFHFAPGLTARLRNFLGVGN